MPLKSDEQQLTADKSGKFDHSAFAKVFVDSLKKYNECIVLSKAIERSLQHDSGSNTQVAKADSKGTAEFTNTQDQPRMMGQVYYLLGELAKKKVFGDENFPVYTIQEIEDAFGVDEEFSIFEDQEQEKKYKLLWEEAKKIMKLGDKDFKMIESMEKYRYGFGKKCLSPEELRVSLRMAEKLGVFKDCHLQNFERLISMCEELN